MSILCKRCDGVILEEPNMPDEFAEGDCDDCVSEDARERLRETVDDCLGQILEKGYAEITRPDGMVMRIEFKHG